MKTTCMVWVGNMEMGSRQKCLETEKGLDALSRGRKKQEQCCRILEWG